MRGCVRRRWFISLMLAGTLAPLIIYLNIGVSDVTISGTTNARQIKYSKLRSEATQQCRNVEHLVTRCDLRSNQTLPGNDKTPLCEVIHVCMICTGHDAVRDASTLIKSLLFHRTNPLHFHFIADKVSLPILKTLLKTWALPSVQYSFYSTSTVFNDISWVLKLDSSVIYSLVKFQLPYILPLSAKRVILLDTNVVLSINIIKLWRQFAEFQPTQMLGLAKNLPSSHLPSSQVNKRPPDHQSYHTGMTLMMLDRMRDNSWANTWDETVNKYLSTFGSSKLAHQGVLDAIIDESGGVIVYTLHCAWSFQMNIQSAFEDSRYSTFKVLHISSQHKQQMHYKTHLDNSISNSSKMYTKFVQYNGNLLKNKPVAPTCHKLQPDVASETHSAKETMPPECAEFEGLGEGSQSRLHLYYIAYNYTVKAGDVTLVSQLSFDRLGMLERLCQAWAGPMSLTFYLSDSQAQQLVCLVRNSPIISSRRNIGYHIVFENGVHYPINYMRNVALNNSLTSYVFLADIDFVPMNKTYEYVRRAAVQNNIHNNKIALVVPAFETKQSKFNFPSNKSELKKLVDRSQVDIFSKISAPYAHAFTNYSRWYEATELYQVDWKVSYEPYIVVSRDIAPRYDERFVDYGFNKITQIMELDAEEFKFQVLPYAFTIHLPHKQSSSSSQFLTNPAFKQCFRAMARNFGEQLFRKHGGTAEKYLVYTS